MKPVKRLYKFTAWVHPADGGDDYPLEGTFDLTGLTNTITDVRRAVRNILRKEGSCILNDFCIERVI
jgi:hypothetical protein